MRITRSLFAMAVVASLTHGKVGLAVRLPFCAYDFAALADRSFVYVPGKYKHPLLATKRLVLDQRWSNPDKYTIVSRETGESQGVLWVERAQGSPIVTTIGLDISHKGSGIGTEAKYALLKYLFEREGVTEVQDWARPHNQWSIDLHRKLGYTISPNISSGTQNMKLTKEAFQKLESESDPKVFFFRANSHGGNTAPGWMDRWFLEPPR